MASNAPPILPPQSRLAGYEIAGLVGRGGMGEVYRAKQLSMQREVALKVLSPRLARSDPAFADQFVAEARAAGKLNHPNIVAVHDVGQAPAPPGCHDVEADQPIHYFSMEFIEGETVKDLIERQGAVDIATIGKVMAAMAEALAFAETHKIVHRDIKPDNIMLTAGGGVKLADLGLALQADSAEAVAGSKDEQGRGKVMGTPLYMAPEQARAQPIDHRADQYALGATLFHMLTGRTPYQGESSKAIMRAHCFEPVPDPAEVNPQVSPPWRDMCMRMLAKLPDDRFAGAADLRAACKAAIRWRPGPVPRVRGNRGRPPWLAITVAAVILLALGWWWLTKAAAPPPARIDDPTPRPATPTTSLRPPPEPAHQARVQVERALAALSGNPAAALAEVERMLADPALTAAHDLLATRRDALRAQVEERRRAPLAAAMDSAFQDATAGRLQSARDGLAKVPEEAWNTVRRAEIAARIELSERTIETRLMGEIDQAGDARACDALNETLGKSELSPARTKGLQERIDLKRRDIAAAKPVPKMLKQDTGPLWKALGEQVEAARSTLPYGNLAEAARSAARNLPDQERLHAEQLAEVAEAAQQAETALRLHIGQATPKADCRFGSRTGTFILTRLEKDSIGVRLVDAPAETKVDRSTAVLPWGQLLSAALSGAGSERSKAAFLWYWRLPEARAAIDGLKDDAMAVAITTYERRTRAIDIPGDQERRKDGVVAISYPFQASRNAGLLGAWKGNGATLTEAGLHWESTSLVPRGSNAESDLSTLAWRSALRTPVELAARVIPDPDSEVVMIGLSSPELGVRLAFNTKLRRAFILATSKDDRATYQAHGAKGAPDYKADGAELRISVDAAGKVALWIDDKPVPLDYELAFPANARITPVIQARPVQARSGISVLSLSLSGKP